MGQGTTGAMARGIKHRVVGISTSAVVAVVLAAISFVAGIEYALVAVIGVAATFLIFRYPLLGVYGLIVLLPFNGIVSQIAEGSSLPTIYGAAKDVILLCLLLVALISGGFARVPGVLLALVVSCVGLALVAGIYTDDFLVASYGWRNDYEPLLLLIIIPAVVRAHHLPRILLALVIAAQATAVIALATWLRGVEWIYTLGRLPVSTPEEFPTSLFSSGNDWPRAFSPYVAPNEMAVVMAVMLAVIWLTPGRRWTVNAALSVLPLVAIYLSASRSGIIGAVVVLCVLAARGISKKSPLLSVFFLLIASFGVVAGAGLYITNRLDDAGDPSIGGHSASMAEGIAMLAEHPLGIGLGLVGPRTVDIPGSYQVESFWLLIALESGLIVLGLFVMLLGVLAVRSIASRTALGFIGAAAIAASLVSQLVLPTFQEGAVSFAVWLVVGLSVVAQQAAKHGEIVPAESDAEKADGLLPASV
ncbi:hypothetical protein FRIG_04800 [Frigoribacterium faeni]|uniref:O-antigen ligase family protein n=1 Tax=Frigoribacterium faeni TaxID=145483 RepID=UPI001FAC8592|nr:O-antigen ligase family protein [Frigoribacterium faeni]MCJ0700455.1 hypothetical protein [Frigoribacterium faeni]